jgi:hypothetical protein
MSKPTKNKGTDGPYLVAAVFCDSIVEGSDRALSVVRIVDRVTLTIPADAPADIPSEEKRLPVSLWALVMFKRGCAKRRHRVRLVMHSPSGKSGVILDKALVFSKEPNGGLNLRLHINFAAKECGQFCLDVLLDGKRFTRMPLAVSVERERKD